MASEEREAIELDHRLARLEALEAQMGSVTTQLSAMKTTEGILVSGVSNFRAFQLKAAGTLNFLKLVAILFGLLNTAALGVGAKIAYTAWPLIKQGLVEYYQHHPDAKIQNHKSEVITAHNTPPPQDAGVDPIIEHTLNR